MGRKFLFAFLALVLLILPLAYSALKSGSTTTGYTDVSCASGVSCSVSEGVLNVTSDGGAGSFSALTVDNVTLDSDLITGLKASTEVAATSDTVLAAETGKNFAVTVTGVTMTLPTAAAGLEYTFLGGAEITFSVDPATTADTIQYIAMSGGDKITSPAETHDSLTLISTAAGGWRVKNMGGTFTDGD